MKLLEEMAALGYTVLGPLPPRRTRPVTATDGEFGPLWEPPQVCFNCSHFLATMREYPSLRIVGTCDAAPMLTPYVNDWFPDRRMVGAFYPSVYCDDSCLDWRPDRAAIK